MCLLRQPFQLHDFNSEASDIIHHPWCGLQWKEYLHQAIINTCRNPCHPHAVIKCIAIYLQYRLHTCKPHCPLSLIALVWIVHHLNWLTRSPGIIILYSWNTLSYLSVKNFRENHGSNQGWYIILHISEDQVRSEFTLWWRGAIFFKMFSTHICQYSGFAVKGLIKIPNSVYSY